MKKGQFKITDYDEIRECVQCNQKKIITEFVRGKGNLFRYQCKECKNSARRTGKPNEGRFKPGHALGKRFEEGHTPWYKLKGVPPPNKGTGTKNTRFDSSLYREWKAKVLERDGGKCVKCSSTRLLAAHHIIPWKDNESLRFDVSNGLTLCCVCHGKEEGFKKGRIPHNKKGL